MPNTQTLVRFAWFIMAVASGNAVALNPEHRLTQYGHTAWRIQDGAIPSAALSFAQTSDGYLWIGTDGGLLRFDGVRFVPESSVKGPVYSLLSDKKGGLWIGLSVQLAHLSAGKLARVGESGGRITAIAVDHNNVIWYTRSHLAGDETSPLCRVEGENAACLGKKEGVPFRQLGALTIDSTDSLWLTAADGIARWKSGDSQSYLPSGLHSARNLAGVAAIMAESDGSILVGISLIGPGLGLQRLVNGTWSKEAFAGFDGGKIQVSVLLRDRDNALWIGTLNEGIYRIHDGRIDHFEENDGLSGNAVTGFFEDIEGNIWVATSNGIDSFHERSIVTLSNRQGLTENEVNSVLATKNGGVWIGNRTALDVLNNGAVSSLSKHEGLPGARVTSMLEDHLGRIWLGVDNKLTIYDGGQFHEVTRTDGSEMGVMISLTEDTNHTVWGVAVRNPKLDVVRIRDDRIDQVMAGSDLPTTVTADPKGGVLLTYRDGTWARIRQDDMQSFAAPTSDGKQVSQLGKFAIGSDGSLYAPTPGAGLMALRQGKTTFLSEKNGLPCNSLNFVLVDGKDNLWAFSNCGLIEVTKTELENLWVQDHPRVNVITFDALDGMVVGRPDFQPAASEGPDGRIWFANGKVLEMIDTDRPAYNSVIPPVMIEAIRANHEDVGPPNNIHLKPVVRDLEIDYTAPSFVIPQKVRFRYKLEGHDTDWQDAGTRRQAFYNDLSPGQYTFRVIACNNSGLWNETGATSSFFIPRAWYQTIWFRGNVITVALLGFWAAYYARLRQVSTSLRLRYNERLDERNRMARELHDTLLQTIQASKLAAEDALASSADVPAFRRSTEKLIGWLERAVEEGRAALNALRYSQADTSDLAAALRLAVAESRVDDRMQSTLDVSGVPKPMQPVVRDEVYQIGYEAIRNACAHSGGTLLAIAVEYGRDLVIRVRDNGKGIESNILDHGKEDHHGLSGMRERAARIGATLDIASSAQNGTSIVLRVPGSLIF
jgi:signal transduction histidine kinase/ligand-binding sensor domain-containing protein